MKNNKRFLYGNKARMAFLDFDLLSLKNNVVIKKIFRSQEAVAVILSGKAKLSIDGHDYLLKRRDVFKDIASAVYIPLNTRFSIHSLSKTEIAICLCSASIKTKSFYKSPEQIKSKTVGKADFERSVKNIVSDKDGSHHLIVGETINPPGNWSSFPPHKHDMNVQNKEVKMEEIYFYKINPPNGFGFQRLYSKNKKHDKSIVIKNNMLVHIPYGYHPVCAMPGYPLYYLWFLAGKRKMLMPNTDPQYKWLE